MLFTCCFTDGHLCAASSVEPVRVALPPAGGDECGRERPADEPAEKDGYPGRRSRREHARRPAGALPLRRRSERRCASRCGVVTTTAHLGRRTPDTVLWLPSCSFDFRRRLGA